MKKYAIEYDVHTEDEKQYFEPVVFPSSYAIDDDEFSDIVGDKTNEIIEEFTTHGSHTNDDGSETEVIYTRGYIQTDFPEDKILKLIKENQK